MPPSTIIIFPAQTTDNRSKKYNADRSLQNAYAEYVSNNTTISR